MSRLPVGATIVVALATAMMVALGVWQLQRRDEKRMLLQRYAANQRLAPVALPAAADDSLLFRRASATCLRPTAWRREAGRALDGSSGWRAIADCRGSAGLRFAVQMGVGGDPARGPGWTGGPVSGYVTHAPRHRSLIGGLFDHGAKPLMLVADTPLPGLKANPAANLDDVPNNHLAYAVQWFLFAAVALVVYAVALRRRRREEREPVAAPPARG